LRYAASCGLAGKLPAGGAKIADIAAFKKTII